MRGSLAIVPTVVLLLWLGGCAGPATKIVRDMSAPAGDLDSALKDYLREQGDPGLFALPRTEAYTDLSGDGRNDVLVLMQSPYWCGTGGCTLLVFQRVDDKFVMRSATSVVREPIYQAGTRSDGWRNLVVTRGGGGGPVGYGLLRYDGSRYTANASLAPIPDASDWQGATLLIDVPSGPLQYGGDAHAAGGTN